MNASMQVLDIAIEVLLVDRLLQSVGRPELLITKLLPPTPELEPESKLVVFDIVLYVG